MTNGMYHPPEPERARKTWDKINRKILRRSKLHQLKRRFLLPFRKLMKAREIVWADGYGGKYPACPRCGEYVYYADLCCFCGQRLKENRHTVGGVLDGREH